jgi:hypothetical protein
VYSTANGKLYSMAQISPVSYREGESTQAVYFETRIVSFSKHMC